MSARSGVAVVASHPRFGVEALALADLAKLPHVRVHASAHGDEADREVLSAPPSKQALPPTPAELPAAACS